MIQTAQPSKRSGQCLCGAVRIRIDRKHIDTGVCHCSFCMKWAGGPLMEVECGTAIHIEGQEFIQYYQSSGWAQRAFCKVCGSHLFIKTVDPESYGVMPGLFDEDDGFVLKRQVFFDQKPDYYSFSNETTNISSDYIYHHFPETVPEKV